MNRLRLAVVACLAACAGCLTDAENSGRWYKGALHAHSYWSENEGDARAFPEQAVAAYRDAGYDFVSLTDHQNAAEDPQKWNMVFTTRTSVLKRITTGTFAAYTNRFPDAESRPLGPRTMVRYRTADEVRARFGRPGEFLVLPGVEVSRSMRNAHTTSDLRMNYVNLRGLVAGAKGHPNRETFRADDWDLDRLLKYTWDETAELAAEQGDPPYLFMVNHPLRPHYDVPPELLVRNPQVRFFELCSKGTDATQPPLPGLDRGGWEADRFWDVVNAFRAQDGQPLLYGVGADDAYAYPDTGLEAGETDDFNRAWVCVRAKALEADAIVRAMQRGDFYASCGVELGDVSFSGGELKVSVPAKEGVAFTVRFIVSKKGFDPSFAEVPFATSEHDEYLGDVTHKRTARKYASDRIGATAKCVTGAKGEAVTASYALGADDLYVRARIESTEPSRLKGEHLKPRVKAAWTQPYCR